MSSPNPYDTPALYDVLVLAGRPSPGVVELSDFGRVTGWDEQKANGQDGATTVKKGSELVKFTATWTLFKDELRDEFAAWETWSRVLDTPVKPKSPKAIDSYHPQLAELGVRSVVVGKRGTVKPLKGKDTGSGTVSVDFIEYNPPKPAPATKVDGSKDTTDVDPRVAAAEARLQQREDTYTALNQGFQSP